MASSASRWAASGDLFWSAQSEPIIYGPYDFPGHGTGTKPTWAKSEKVHAAANALARL